MKIAVVINSQRMTPELQSQFDNQTLSAKYNISFDLFITPPNEIEDQMKSINLKSYSACLVGGGDGTVRSAIQVLIDEDVPLIIIPLGTFNVFARDLNYPNDLEEIFKIIKNNKTKQVDLAEVNNEIIVNHAWIGFYYYVLKMREKHKETLGKNKFLKIIFNLYNFFRFLPIYDLEFKTDEKVSRYKTCLVFVSNNDFYTNISDLGERKSLSSGLLSIAILNCTSKWQLFRNMLRIPFNALSDSKYITEFQTENLIITTKTEFVNVVIDGELFKLKSPLHFVNHKKKLTVFTV